jgi:hypothetical protein
MPVPPFMPSSNFNSREIEIESHSRTRVVVVIRIRAGIRVIRSRVVAVARRRVLRRNADITRGAQQIHEDEKCTYFQEPHRLLLLSLTHKLSIPGPIETVRRIRYCGELKQGTHSSFG